MDRDILIEKLKKDKTESDILTAELLCEIQCLNEDVEFLNKSIATLQKENRDYKIYKMHLNGIIETLYEENKKYNPAKN